LTRIGSRLHLPHQLPRGLTTRIYAASASTGRATLARSMMDDSIGTTPHTPGPWEVREHDGLFAITHPSGWVLESDDVRQNRSDARLIADAPKMLALIRDLHDFAEPMRHYEYAEKGRQAFRDAAILLAEHGG
jgi:hypothetical protein